VVKRLAIQEASPGLQSERVPLLDFSSFAPSSQHELPIIEDLRAAFARVRSEVFAPHRHDYFEVFVIRSGEASTWLEHGEHQVLGPSLCLLPPGVVHAWRRSPQVDGYLLRVPCSALGTTSLPTLSTLRSGPSVSGLSGEVLQRADSLARWLHDEVAAAKPLHADIVRAQVQLLFLELARVAEPIQLAGAALSDRALLERFLALTEANYRAHWSVPEYAARLRVGRARLARTTQRLLGKSPATLIQDRVVAEARRLVAHTDLRLGQVADDLGFPSQAYFCRVFRQATGFAPTDYRSRATRGAAQSGEQAETAGSRSGCAP
jgi:AraC-like DNA-binding protein